MVRRLYATVVGTCLLISMIFANMAMMVSLRTRLDILRDDNLITEDQYLYIVFDLVANDEVLDAVIKDHEDPTTRPPVTRIDEFIQWLDEEVTKDRLSHDTADLITNLFNLYPLGADAYKSSVPNGPASANYDGYGVVQLFGRLNFWPNMFYNGIWGYEYGEREYALQCTAGAFHILDVTSNEIVKIQTIPMDGGNIWRDVATHSHYAYVAAQNNGNAWIINLQELSPSTAQASNSNPIPDEHIKDIGFKNWGHTLNVAEGLLFLNSAGGGEGCKIFDLEEDPWNPRVLVEETAVYFSSSECHDSYVQAIDDKVFMITSDGYTKRWRLFDITGIRDNPLQIPLVSSTPTIGGSVYAHQAAISDDGKILFVFEEFDNFDIGVYDISDIARPILIRQFQWSSDNSQGCPVHNGFARGNYLFVAYYSAGLRVFDISDVYSGISEVGYYGTYSDPDGDGNLEHQIGGGNGAWNVYVGFSSGKVLVSDADYGTFVVTINESSKAPTKSPKPSKTPTPAPTKVPTTNLPTQAPTKIPITNRPTTNQPTPVPTKVPTTNLPTQAPTKVPTTNRPTTSQPTPAPTKVPITNWPTPTPLACPTSKSYFKVSIQTDNFGYELRYSLRQMTLSGEMMGKPILLDCNLPSNAQVINETCISPTACYMFKIVDQREDGSCCSITTGNRMYELFVNGDTKRKSFFSKSKEMTKVGKCYISPTISPAPVLPTAPSTEAPTVPMCPLGKSHFKVIINTDSDGHEMKYSLVKRKLNGGWSKKKYLAGKNLPSNDTVEDEICITPTRCYRFKIRDRGGKQLNRNGSYTLWLNGKLKKTSQYINKKVEKTLIGVACWA